MERKFEIFHDQDDLSIQIMCQNIPQFDEILRYLKTYEEPDVKLNETEEETIVNSDVKPIETIVNPDVKPNETQEGTIVTPDKTEEETVVNSDVKPVVKTIVKTTAKPIVKPIETEEKTIMKPIVKPIETEKKTIVKPIETKEETIVKPIVKPVVKSIEETKEEPVPKTYNSQLTKNAYQLGYEGEKSIENYLKQFFKDDYFIENLGKVNHSNDILMHNDSELFSFEIKNKQTIIKDDLTKFYSDSKLITEKHTQSIKLFVFYSINTKIPSKDNFQMEIIDGHIYTFCNGIELIETQFLQLYLKLMLNYAKKMRQDDQLKITDEKCNQMKQQIFIFKQKIKEMIELDKNIKLLKQNNDQQHQLINGLQNSFEKLSMEAYQVVEQTQVQIGVNLNENKEFSEQNKFVKIMTEMKGKSIKKADVFTKYQMTEKEWTQFRAYMISKGIVQDGVKFCL